MGIKSIVFIISALLFTSCGVSKSEVAQDSGQDSVQETPATEEESQTMESDFTPPSGAGNHEGTEGPWARRLLGAYSKDGLTWTKTNKIISDQADVADLTVDENGRLYLYYYGWTVGDRQNITAMAISDDNGSNWIFKNMKFSGFPNRGDVSDPNVVYDNGIFQLYGSTRDNGRTYIVHGEGIDGISFTYNGIAFKPDSGNAGVAATYKVGDVWHLLSLASLGIKDNNKVEPGTIWHATSADGESFTLDDTLTFHDGKYAYFEGNVIPFDDGYRLYVFSPTSTGIRSYFSADGKDWTLEEGYRLNLEENSPLESGYVGDPDVVQLSDGTYFMVYSSLIE